jgi:hypothetical protein
MEKLDKEIIANIYSKLSVVMGLGIFIILFMYFNNLPELMYGPVEKGMFNLDFSVGFEMNIIVFNLPLIFFTLLFLYNLGMLIYTQTGNKMEANNVTESMFYNTILSFLLIVSQFVFVYMVPDSINGIIEVGLFQYEFVELSDLSTKGINFGYILATIYTFYSIFVLYLETRQDDLDL